MDYTQQIIALILAPSSVLIGVAFLLRKWFDNQFALELETFKTRFSYIHNKRADVLGRMYSHLVDATNALSQLTSLVKFNDGRSIENQKQEVVSAFSIFHNLYRRNRLYIDKDICEDIDAILKIMASAYYDYDIATWGHKHHHDKTHVELLKKAWEQMSVQIPPLFDKIELRFRTILGVIDNKGAG